MNATLLTPAQHIPAIEQARAMFGRGGVRDFEADLADHLRTGFVYAMPGLFAMAKAVLLDDGRAAWLVHHAHGPLLSLLSIMPMPMPWIALNRRYDLTLRVYPTARLRRLALAAHRQIENHKAKAGINV